MSQDMSESAEKPISEWTTGDEPVSGARQSYSQTLLQEAGRDGSTENLTKVQAWHLIDELQAETGRKST